MTDTGLLCPKCNSATGVYDSRPKPNGTTRRYRKCLCCGFCFHTVEAVMEKSKVKGMMKNEIST